MRMGGSSRSGGSVSHHPRRGSRAASSSTFPYGLYRQKEYLPLLTTTCRVARVAANRLEGFNHSEVFAPRDIGYVVDLAPAPTALRELPRRAFGRSGVLRVQISVA